MSDLELGNLLLDLVDHRLTDEWQGFTVRFQARTDGETSTLDRIVLTSDEDAA